MNKKIIFQELNNQILNLNNKIKYFLNSSNNISDEVFIENYNDIAISFNIVKSFYEAIRKSLTQNEEKLFADYTFVQKELMFYSYSKIGRKYAEIIF